MIGNPLLLPDEGYNISRSVRLRSSANAYFSKTWNASSGTTDTFSFWVKRGKLGAAQSILDTSNGVNISFGVYFTAADVLEFYDYSSAYRLRLVTTQVFRDPSAWYHIVCQLNTTNATAANRAKVFVNGVEVTSFSTATYPAQNTSLNLGSPQAFGIGVVGNAGGQNFDGLLTEINFIDGQALTPSSFGETDAITGVWKPKKYAGTYGTNGFYLNFSDNSAATAAAIGKDYSGNGNNWTPNNISVTAGVTYDSMLDVPTLWADGGNGRGNYAVLNPIGRRRTVSTLPTFSEANLRAAFPNASGNATYAMSTIGVTSGKWYWEVPVVTRTTEFVIGIGDSSTLDEITGVRGYQATTGTINGFTSNNGPGATYTSGDVIGVALDVGAGTCAFYKNDVLQATGTGLGFTTIHPFIQGNTSDVANANFGQRPFAYTPPTGFKALNTQNLPEPTIKKGNAYFDATLYTGTGSAQSIVNSGAMQPDLVWTKSRSVSNDHILMDSVRGLSVALFSNLTNAEVTDSTRITSLNANGFTLGTSASTNQNAVTFVGWQWNAGGSTVTNTSGSISAQVRANATAGFSVVTWTGKVSYPDTIGHGLGVVPSMIIIKNRNYAPGINWAVYHISLGNTKALYLNSTAAPTTDVGFWNNTNPTSTVFTTGNGVGYATGGNTNTYVAYCLAPVAGYSAFGSYTGNGSTDGPFVFTGFRPRFVLIKYSSGVGSWWLYDSARDIYNVAQNFLMPNNSNAETVVAGPDFTSNGFKIRSSTGDLNTSSGTYIYMAFAENPFKLSLAR